MPTHCGSPPPRRGRHERLQPGVRLDLGRVGVLAALGRREQVAGDVAGRDAVAAQQHEREVREVLADARAGVEQVLDLRADVGHAGAVLEAVGDHLHHALERGRAGCPRARARRARRRAGRPARRRRGAGTRSRGRGMPAPSAAAQPPSGGSGGLVVATRARTSTDSDVVRLGDPELDHGRAVVVEVLVQPRLRLHADAEVVDALDRRGGRRHAQRVEVVGDRPVVAVLGQVADREVHQAVASLATGADAPPK